MMVRLAALLLLLLLLALALELLPSAGELVGAPFAAPWLRTAARLLNETDEAMGCFLNGFALAADDDAAAAAAE
jgi:hypothetical protein